MNTIFALTLAWCASTSPNVTSYRLYFSDHQQDSRTVDTTALQAQAQNLIVGHPYYFHVTALDAAGDESDPSNELDYVIPTMQMVRAGVVRFNRPVYPGNVQYVLESTENLSGPWAPDSATETVVSTTDGIQTVEMTSTTLSAQRFYRVHLIASPSGC